MIKTTIKIFYFNRRTFYMFTNFQKTKNNCIIVLSLKEKRTKMSFYKDKKVFVTGASGFKGSWLCLWLKSQGAEVCGYSLEPNTNTSMFLKLEIDKEIKNIYGNILEKRKLKKAIQEFKPDILFHLAAQPLVRYSYAEPILTYETNVMGTLNVLNMAFKCPSIKAFVNVTTDKCYENREIEHGYSEDEKLGGYDMYSSSKACVEIMSASFRRSFLQSGKMYSMATARAGNVIGGGDWALDRLVPDCVRAINDNHKIEIRNPNAIRPWQHVLEPLSGYLLLGQKLFEDNSKYSSAFNFGPNKDSVLTVAEVAKRVCENYGKGEVVIGQKSPLHEANLLMLNVEKAKNVLGWTPTYNADIAIKKTVEWYKKFYEGASEEEVYKFTLSQIKDFMNK